MLRIGLVTKKYRISHRTLRHWEKVGLVESIRGENEYRYYDEGGERRIKEILILRKFDVGIKDIESIFSSDDVKVIIGILKEHLADVDHKVQTMHLISISIAELIHSLESQSTLGEIMDVLAESASGEKRSATEALAAVKKEEMTLSDEISQDKEMRVVNLPRMVVASIAMSGENPEDKCWRETLTLIEKHRLDQEACFRSLGHGYHDEDGKYVYELWTAVPRDFHVPHPFARKDFCGGLFAALPTHLDNIGEAWPDLHDLVVQSGIYEHDADPSRDMCLEECLDIVSFHDPRSKDADRQLDLLLPIRRVDKKVDGGAGKRIKAEVVVLPDLLLGGTYFHLREAVSPWKKRVPWYQLAQNIYRIGSDVADFMNRGNNTFTIIYGRTINPIPFYLDLERGKAMKIFAAVELKRPFPSYPEGLCEMALASRKYMMFSTWIDTSLAKSVKLAPKCLYEAASAYFESGKGSASEDFCIERDYRANGRYVDRIELYIPLDSTD